MYAGVPAISPSVARHLEQIGPLCRVRHVGAQAAAQRRLEVEFRGDHEEALGPGVALELDAERLADGAAPAIRSNDIVGFEL
jgi:hypothetical protein